MCRYISALERAYIVSARQGPAVTVSAPSRIAFKAGAKDEEGDAVAMENHVHDHSLASAEPFHWYLVLARKPSLSILAAHIGHNYGWRVNRDVLVHVSGLFTGTLCCRGLHGSTRHTACHRVGDFMHYKIVSSWFSYRSSRLLLHHPVCADAGHWQRLVSRAGPAHCVWEADDCCWAQMVAGAHCICTLQSHCIVTLLMLDAGHAAARDTAAALCCFRQRASGVCVDDMWVVLQ